MAKKPQRPKKPENKQLREIGKANRSGRLISEYLRGIGTQSTELILDPETGQNRVVTKAEALAYKIWLKAMGYVMDPETGQLEDTGDINLDYVRLVLDRSEGKAGVQVDDPGKDRRTAADRVSELNRERLNSLADGGE